MLLLQYRLVIHQSSNFSWLGLESSMEAYRHTIVVLLLHYVFGSPDLSPWCLSGFDLPIWFPPVFHSNASRSLHLMYCFPAQMIYRLAFSRFHRQSWCSLASRMDPCRSRRRFSLCKCSRASDLALRFFQLTFPSPAIQPLSLDIATFFLYLFYLPLRFPFLHWKKQKSFRSLPRIVWL